jgi:hypothetical protein
MVRNISGLAEGFQNTGVSNAKSIEVEKNRPIKIIYFPLSARKSVGTSQTYRTTPPTEQCKPRLSPKQPWGAAFGNVVYISFVNIISSRPYRPLFMIYTLKCGAPS